MAHNFFLQTSVGGETPLFIRCVTQKLNELYLIKVLFRQFFIPSFIIECIPRKYNFETIGILLQPGSNAAPDPLEHLSLKVPNIEFDFDVCVDSM